MPMDARDWDARYAASELVWPEGPNRFVEEVVTPLPPGRAIDLACGEGRNGIWLAQRGWSVTGVDYSHMAIDKARKLAVAAGVEVDWRCDDVTRFEPAVHSCELALLSYLHLPAEQMAAVCARARRVLSDRGMLLVVGHARANLTEGVGGPQDPALLYDPEDVVGWIRDLEILRAEHVTRDVEGGLRRAIDTLVVATTGSA